MRPKKKYLYASIFFLSLQLLVIIKNLLTNNYIAFFWFCDFVPILFSIAFFLEDEQLAKGLINIGFIPQLAYFAILFSAVSFGIGTSQVFDILNSTRFYIFSSFILHLVSVNVALFLTYKARPQQKSLIYSFAFIFLMLLFSLLAPDSLNANYIHHFDFFGHTITYLIYFWIILTFVIVVVPTYFIQYALYTNSIKNASRKG